MSEKVIIKELENQTIINNEESPDTLIVTGPTSPSETIIVTEASPSTTIVEQSHPVTIMISHGGSAYIDAVNKGFKGTEVDWLNHILNSKAEVSYVDGLLVQEASDRETAINNLAAQIARDFATKLELSSVSSDISTKITEYDNQLKQYLNQYSTVQFVETEFDDRFGYMVQRIETLEGGLGNNSAIIQKINEIVLTESEARATELANLEARVGLNYATKNELSVVESTAEQARAALETSLSASFNNRISAEMTSVNESIANERLARTTSYQQLEANFNNITIELNNLEQVISTETQQRAQAIQSLNAELVGYQQVQSSLYQEIDSRVGGNTTAIAGFRTAITGNPNATQTQAEIGLESIKTQAGDAYSRAYLTVSNTVNGVTTVTGITADSLNNMLAFSAGAMSLRDSKGVPRLFWSETTDTWTFSGKLVLGDGSSLDGMQDIQDLIGPRHYIKSLNGTAIKNHTGSITVEARTVTGTIDELSKVGYLRTADNPSVNLGNTHTFTAAEISDSTVVEMVVSGVVCDTITLADITDGADGSDAIVGFVEADRISWVQDKSGIWPVSTTNTVTAHFFQNGVEIAKQIVTLSLQTSTGFINHSLGTGNDINVSVIGSGTNEITLKFTHIPSGIQVIETFFSVTSGKDGVSGTDGNSVAIIYAADSAGNDQSYDQGNRKFVQYYEYKGDLPTLPVSGTFVRFIGEDGEPANSIWAIYASSEAGTDQSFSPIGKSWVTFYESLTQPTLPVTATFVKYVGDNGVNGIDGTDGMSVLVIYAEDADGNNQSLEAGSRRFINYYEYVGNPPELPVDAKFVEFVGEDGSPGQGVWPIYASDSDGSDQSFDPEGKEWVTFYESVTKPTLPVSATFVKYVGEDGAQGPAGSDGYNTATLYAYKRAAVAPTDNPGSVTYTFSTKSWTPGNGWQKSIPSNNGNPLWVTVATAVSRNNTDSIASNEWSAPVEMVANGEDGEDGFNTATVYLYRRTSSSSVPGKPTGTLTYNFETKQLTGTPGNGWSITPPTSGGKYLWFCQATAANRALTDTIPGSEFSTAGILAVDGDQGPQGVPGTPGADGTTYYTWIRYADDANGTGISNNPSGKEYIGFAYNKTTPVESDNPSDYSWSLIKGTDGVQGPPGEDGVTTYTWIAYSDNADGSGMYQTPTENTKYIGIATNKTTPTESTNPADYVWSRFRGADGNDGKDGKDGKDGIDGSHGAGFYGGTYSSINWTTSTANSRFTALVGRAPIPLDIFVQTRTDGTDSQARQYNGSSWVTPTLMLHGSLIATGTVAGQVLIAGTEINSPVVKSGQILMVGASHMKITTSTPFGPNNLIEWYGPKNTDTYDSANNSVNFDALTKANAITYLSAAGEAYFGGSIIAGTLRNSVQNTMLAYSTSTTLGPFGSNGGPIEIKCSFSATRGTGLVAGSCPFPRPANPTGTLRLYRTAPGAQTLVATHALSGVYDCSDEGQEHIENWLLIGGFTYTDNLQTTQPRTYRLEVTHNTPVLPNGNQRLSLISEEA